MPVAAILHGYSQSDQRVIRSWLADDLEGNRHAAVVEADRDRNGRKSEHVDEAGPVAELIERFRFEPGSARVAFGSRRRPHREYGQADGVCIAKYMGDKIVRELPAGRKHLP